MTFHRLAAATALLALGTTAHASTYNISYSTKMNLIVETQAAASGPAGLLKVTDASIVGFPQISELQLSSSVFVNTTGSLGGIATFVPDGSFVDLGFSFRPPGAPSTTDFFQVINVPSPPPSSGNRFFSANSVVVTANEPFDQSLFSATLISTDDGSDQTGGGGPADPGDTADGGQTGGGQTGGGTGAGGTVDLGDVADGGQTGGDVPDVAPIPLPAGGWLLLGAFGALVGFGRRSSNRG